MKQIFNKYFVTQCGQVYNRHNKKLSPCDNGKGYLILGLMIEGKRRTIAVHRLVALAYLDNPKNLPEVNHINANRLDNNVSNLEWVTHGENVKHSYQLQNKTVKGEHNPNASVSEKDVREICQYLTDGLKSAQIRDLGYNYNIVRKIKRKVVWKDIVEQYSF